jgi:hypothetical protein
VKEINDAAEWFFRCNRAETMVVNAADYGVELDDGTSSAESDEDVSDEEIDDSDYDTYCRKYRAKRRARKEKERKARSKKKSASTISVSGKTPTAVGTAEEVSTLIRQLNKMSITDPEYPPVFYKVLALDTTGVAVKCVQPPRLANGWADGNKGPTKPRDNIGPVVNPPTISGVATYPNNIPLGTPGSARIEFSGCFGCLKDGHRIGECPEIQDLLNQDMVYNDSETQRLRMKDGSFIKRLVGESLAQAARRISTPCVMFVTVEPKTLTEQMEKQSYNLESRGAWISEISEDETIAFGRAGRRDSRCALV